jgi:hypothetical protein
MQSGKIFEFVSPEGKRRGFGHSFAALHATARMDGKRTFVALCNIAGNANEAVI